MPKIVALSRIAPKIVDFAFLVVEIDDDLPVMATPHDDELGAGLHVIAGDLRIDRISRHISRTVLNGSPKRTGLEVRGNGYVGCLKYRRGNVDQLHEIVIDAAPGMRPFDQMSSGTCKTESYIVHFWICP